MDELTFIKLAAKEIETTRNSRLKELYAWSKTTLEEQGSCLGVKENQALHAATVACDLLMRAGIVEDSGEYIHPHPVDTILNEQDTAYLRYYYIFDPVAKTLTIEVLQCDPVSHCRLPIQTVLSMPLVLKLNSPAVTDANKTESGIILTA